MGQRVTLGVSIAIPEPHASVLSGWRCRVGDTLGELIPPHVTLLPPTPVDRDELPGIRAHLVKAAEAATAFPMHLFGTGTFRPMSPVVFIHVAMGITYCEALEQSIRSGPLARDLEFTYHPHVTVAQEISAAQLDQAYDGLSDFMARFTVDRFSLFERDGQNRWTKQEDFPLGLT
jgi:2'-5' RNA ligase